MNVPDETQAYAEIVGEYPNQKLNLHLPRGDRGEKGDKGDKGDTGDTGASTTLTVLETTTGVDYQYPGPQGPAGTKGDPGGFVDGTELGTNNLNNITATGIYKQTTSANTTPENNYPFSGIMAILTVFKARPTDVFQIIEPGNGVRSGSVTYKRSSADSGVTWSSWRAFASQRLDQTSGRAIYTWDDAINREQIIYGDTGLRSIGVLRNATTTTGGVAYLRRNGSLVTIHLTGLAVATSAVGFVIIFDAGTLPVGFRPPLGGFRTTVTTAGGEARILELQGDGSVQIYGPSAAAYSGSITFATNDTWPTTLPGTAYGSIPNL